MFSSILPNASSSAKFVQNGHSRVPSTFRFTILSLMKSMSQNPSRFSVRVFRNPAASTFSYPMATKMDFGYRSVQQSEQQRYVPRYAFSSSLLSGLLKLGNPHISSNHNISYDARLRTNNYAIYPGALNDTYIYEQSTCSEYDALSTATFSPAMSTDSTLTSRSPPMPERFLEERAGRPATPAVPPGYAVHGSMVSQPPAMSRTTSNHYTQPSGDTSGDRRSRVTSMQGPSTTPIRLPIPSASLNELTQVSSTTSGYNCEPPSHIPEYAPSTISELEVDERDKIARINAEYNAVSSSSSSSYHSNDNVAVESIVRQMSTSVPNRPLQDTFAQANSQPLNQFPTKPDNLNSSFNLNSYPTPAILSTKDGSPPLVERVPSRVEFLPTNSQSSQFLPPQAQDSWNCDGVYHPDHARVPLHRPPPPPTTSRPFDAGSASRFTQTSSQETTSLNEYRPLPVPPAEARQRSTVERRPSVVGPRPDVNVLKGASDVRHRSQTTREYSYDQRREASNSPPRGGLTLQSSAQELPNRASEMRRDTRTPAPRESDDYRPAPLMQHQSYLANPQQPPVEPRSQIPTNLQTAALIRPTETERSNDRIRTRSTSFSTSTQPSLPPVKVEPERRNDVRGEAIYNSQLATPTFNRETQSSNLPIGQPSSKSNDRAPSYPTINPRNVTKDVPGSRSRTPYFEIPASGLPTHGAALYDKLSKTGSSLTNSTDQEYVPPEQPTHRRYSDGDQNPPPSRPVESSGRSSAPLIRSVRWTENLICPSPVLASKRRKGWFNRRG